MWDINLLLFFFCSDESQYSVRARREITEDGTPKGPRGPFPAGSGRKDLPDASQRKEAHSPGERDVGRVRSPFLQASVHRNTPTDTLLLPGCKVRSGPRKEPRYMGWSNPSSTSRRERQGDTDVSFRVAYRFRPVVRARAFVRRKRTGRPVSPTPPTPFYDDYGGSLKGDRRRPWMSFRLVFGELFFVVSITNVFDFCNQPVSGQDKSPL